MHKIVLLSAAGLLFLPATEMRAQTGKKSLPTAQSAVDKSTTLYGGATVNGADVDFDADLRLSMKGTSIVSGTLDACTTTDGASTVSDRVRIPLTVKGNDLTGAGTTELGKLPVTLTLKKSGTPESITLAGQMTVGSVPIQIKAEELDLQTVEASDASEADPPAVAIPSFNAITVKTPLAKVTDALGVLRSEQVVLGTAGLVPSCLDMRSGATQLEATVNPANVAGVLGRLNAIEGVQARMVEINEPSMTVRIPQQQAGGRKDEDLVASITKAIVAATGGRNDDPPAIDPKTGEYELKLRRDSTLSKRIGLSEQLSSRFLIGRDPRSQDVYVIISGMTAKLVDRAPSQKLVLSDDSGASEEGGGNASGVNTTYLDDLIVKAVARDLNGQTWDGEGEKWR